MKTSSFVPPEEPCFFHYCLGKCSRKPNCGHSHNASDHQLEYWRPIWAKRKQEKNNSSSQSHHSYELDMLRRENAELKTSEKIRYQVEKTKAHYDRKIADLEKKIETQGERLHHQQTEIAVGKQAMLDLKSKKERVIVPAFTHVIANPRYRTYYCRYCGSTRHSGYNDCGCSISYKNYTGNWYDPITGISHINNTSVVTTQFLAIE